MPSILSQCGSSALALCCRLPRSGPSSCLARARRSLAGLLVARRRSNTLEHLQISVKPAVYCSPDGDAAGTIEYALAEDRLTEEGDVWAPDAEDVTMQVCRRQMLLQSRLGAAG